MCSLRFATMAWSCFTCAGVSAVYTIMAPFLSATTCERAPMARASLSICSQSSHAPHSCATPFWCSAQRRPATAVEADVLPQRQLALAPCVPQPIALPELLAVTAEAPLALLQPIAAAVAASWLHAALMAVAEQPPSAATVGVCPFTEATTAFAV